MRKKYLFYSLFLILGFVFVIGAFLNRYITQKTGLSLFAKRPFISVLVTSYNYERYLRQTLDSILAQSYKNYEVVIVDDGSTDKSVSVINEYVAKYKNFHLYQHEGGVNKGLPASFKLGVEKSKGEYISVLESDDYWTPDNLLEKIKMINKHPDAVIIYNKVIPFGDDYNSKIQGKFAMNVIHKQMDEVNYIKNSDDLFNVIVTFSSVIIQRDLLLKLDFDTPIPAFLDLYLYRQIFEKYPLYYIGKPLTYWRRHVDSYNAFKNQAANSKKSDIFLSKLKKVIQEQKKSSF